MNNNSKTGNINALLKRKIEGKGTLSCSQRSIEGDFRLAFRKDGQAIITFEASSNNKNIDTSFEFKDRIPSHDVSFGNIKSQLRFSKKYWLTGSIGDGRKLNIEKLNSFDSYNSTSYKLRTTGHVEILCPDEQSLHAYGLTNLVNDELAGLSLCIDGSNINFRQDINYKKSISLFESDKITSRVTYWLLFNEKTDYEVSKKIVDDICWLISFAEGFLTVPYCSLSSRENYLEANSTERFWNDRTRFIGDNRICRLFSDPRDMGCYSLYLNGCSKTFKDLQQELEFKSFIYTYLYAAPAPVVLKIATFLLAFQLLAGNYLTSRKIVKPDADLGIGDLFRKINGQLKFLTKDEHKSIDTFAKEVRNSLFHRGKVEGLSMNQKILVSDTLASFCQRLFLKIIGFKGSFRDSLGIRRSMA
jgi:hypothetical protein